MNKHVLALSTALSILVFTPAFAQNNTAGSTTGGIDCTQQANMSDPACTNTNNNSNAAGQTMDNQTGAGTTADTSSGSTTTTTDGTAAGSTAATGSGTASSTTQMSATELIVPADQLDGDQIMSANDFIGKTVYDQAGNNIGDVNDLILANSGQIQAVILGVGGFLGIGEKDVAVNTQAIQIVKDGDTQRLVVQTTKEALNNAPSYDRTNRRYATGMSTGTDATGSTTAPATGTNATGTGAGTTGTGTTDTQQ